MKGPCFRRLTSIFAAVVTCIASHEVVLDDELYADGGLHRTCEDSVEVVSLLQTHFDLHPGNGTKHILPPPKPFTAGGFAAGCCFGALFISCCMVVGLAYNELRIWSKEDDPSSPRTGVFQWNGVSMQGFTMRGMLSVAAVLVPFDYHAQVSSVISTSYDLALSVDLGAAASGWLISSIFVGAFFGSMSAKKWLKEEAGYCHRRARSGLFLGAAISTTGLAFYAGALYHFDGKQLFHILTALRIVIGYGSMFSFIIGPIMAYRAIPLSQRTMFSMAITVTKNLGLVVGPAISAVAIQMRVLALTAEQPAQKVDITLWSPRERAFWPAVVSAFCGLAFSMFLLVATPVDLPALEDDLVEPPPTPRPPGQRQTTEALFRPDMMSEDNRKQIFKLTIGYQVERAVIVSAIEVSTLMILEKGFKLNTVDASYLFSGVSSASTVIVLICMVLLHRRLISELRLFMVAASLSVGGALLFCDFGGLTTLLMADFIIYGFSGAALGVSEGWGTLAATGKASFTQAQWRMLSAMCSCIMRMATPPLARGLIERGGRSEYAAAQLCVVMTGFYTAVKACSIMSDSVRELPATPEVLNRELPRTRSAPATFPNLPVEKSILFVMKGETSSKKDAVEEVTLK